MKSLTRTIIMLAIFNLAIGSFALAQAERKVEGTGEPTAPQPVSRPAPPQKPAPEAVAEAAEPSPVPPPPALQWDGKKWEIVEPGAPVPPQAQVPAVPAAPPAPSTYSVQTRWPGRISSRKVLVIPDTEVKSEELDALTQDLLVMSHILDERFKESRTIKGVFTDFGDFFGRDNRATEAIYMQGYGALFLMEVNFAFSPPLKSEERKEEKTAEHIDPTWQRAKQQIFSPKPPMPGMLGFSEQGPGLVKIDQLKKELIEALKHAANIRNLSPDEWIIVTVIGQGRQVGMVYYETFGAAAPRSNYSSSSQSTSQQSSTGQGGGYAASSSSGVAGGYGMVGDMGRMMGGGMYGGMGGYGGGMGGYGGEGYGYGGMGGFGGGMMSGGMAGYGEMSLPSTTVLTIRVKKGYVDAFAGGELDFEQFQKIVEIFTY